MLVALYMNGRLKIDEMISHTCPLDEINTAGEVARSVIVFD